MQIPVKLVPTEVNPCRFPKRKIADCLLRLGAPSDLQTAVARAKNILLVDVDDS